MNAVEDMQVMATARPASSRWDSDFYEPNGAEWFWAVHRRGVKRPEHALLVELLAQAYNDIFPKHALSRSRSKTKAQAALAWVVSPTFEVWSFLWCCEHLGIDGERIAEQIVKQAEEEYGMEG